MPKPSPILSAQEPQATPFSAWFGTSRVVEPDGSPKVVYHGTTETTHTPAVLVNGSASARAELQRLAHQHGIKDWDAAPSVFERWAKSPEMVARFGVTQPMAEHARELHRQARSTQTALAKVEIGFSIFRMPDTGQELGAHFGTKTQAANFGEPFEFFLKIENPLRLPDLGTWEFQEVMVAARKKRVSISGDEFDAVSSSTNPNDALRKLLGAKGYDGVVYKNDAEGAGDSYIIFRPEQAKSATDNSGAFDPVDPDIRDRRAAQARDFLATLGTQPRARP